MKYEDRNELEEYYNIRLGKPKKADHPGKEQSGVYRGNDHLGDVWSQAKEFKANELSMCIFKTLLGDAVKACSSLLGEGGVHTLPWGPKAPLIDFVQKISGIEIYLDGRLKISPVSISCPPEVVFLVKWNDLHLPVLITNKAEKVCATVGEGELFVVVQQKDGQIVISRSTGKGYKVYKYPVKK